MSIQALLIHHWSYCFLFHYLCTEFHSGLNILSQVLFRFSIYNFHDVFLLTNLSCSVLLCVVGILLVLLLAKISIIVALESFSCSNFSFAFCRSNVFVCFQSNVFIYPLFVFNITDWFFITCNCCFMNDLIASFSVSTVFI